MKDTRTMKQLFDKTFPMFRLLDGETSSEYVGAFAVFSAGYGRGVLDTINQRKEMTEETPVK